MPARRVRDDADREDEQPALDEQSVVQEARSFADFMRESFPYRNSPDLEVQFKLFYAANRAAYGNRHAEALAAWERSLNGEAL